MLRKELQNQTALGHITGEAFFSCFADDERHQAACDKAESLWLQGRRGSKHMQTGDLPTYVFIDPNDADQAMVDAWYEHWVLNRDTKSPEKSSARSI